LIFLNFKFLIIQKRHKIILIIQKRHKIILIIQKRHKIILIEKNVNFLGLVL